MLANYAPLGPGPGTWTLTVVVETRQCKSARAIGYASVALPFAMPCSERGARWPLGLDLGASICDAG